MSRALAARVFARACVLFALPALLVACAPTAVRPNRTEGLELECQWTTAAHDRVAYYTVTSDGMFRSAGGALAMDRGTDFAVKLSDSDVATFVKLTRATDCAQREDTSQVSGDRTQLRVRDGKWYEWTLWGADDRIDALRAWCASVSMRRFSDLIEAQPNAGPRVR